MYLTLHDVSPTHKRSVGITNCSTSSCGSNVAIVTHASTARSLTESYKNIIILFFYLSYKIIMKII